MKCFQSSGVKLPEMHSEHHHDSTILPAFDDRDFKLSDNFSTIEVTESIVGRNHIEMDFSVAVPILGPN